MSIFPWGFSTIGPQILELWGSKFPFQLTRLVAYTTACVAWFYCCCCCCCYSGVVTV